MDASLEALWANYGLLPGDSVDLPTFPDSPDCADLLSDDALDPADLLNLEDPDPFVSHDLVSVCTTGTQTPADNPNASSKILNPRVKFQCHVCDEKFSSDSVMRNHLLKVHGIGRGFRCGKCDYTSSNRFHVLEHMTAKHTGVQQEYRCPDCNLQFKKRGGLTTHLKYHEHDPPNTIYKCTLCHWTTKSRDLLRRHLKTTHGKKLDGGELVLYKHSCDFCDFRSHKLHLVRQHVARFHSHELTTSSSSSSSSSSDSPKRPITSLVLSNLPKMLKCPLCPYSTTVRADLDKHERNHTGEKPFVCDVCPYRSVTRSGVLRHKRTHSQVKPHICPECGLTYADKKRLKDHLLKHEGKKPFPCDICGQQFRRRDNLKMHLQRIHSRTGDQ